MLLTFCLCPCVWTRAFVVAAFFGIFSVENEERSERIETDKMSMRLDTGFCRCSFFWHFFGRKRGA
nr:MAG TPA: hypothetical protein [Microviridae sp.]